MEIKNRKILEHQALIFKAMGQPTRLEILNLLKDGERCVCEIFPEIKQEQANVSKHLAILKQAGILDSRKEGLRIIYWIKNPEILKLLGTVSTLLKVQAREHQELMAQG
jgi:DNA-binding transcriptional ArsR family regulator